MSPILAVWRCNEFIKTPTGVLHPRSLFIPGPSCCGAQGSLILVCFTCSRAFLNTGHRNFHVFAVPLQFNHGNGLRFTKQKRVRTGHAGRRLAVDRNKLIADFNVSATVLDGLAEPTHNNLAILILEADSNIAGLAGFYAGLSLSA